MPNWDHVLREIQKEKNDGIPGGQSAADKVRRKYMMQLHQAEGRNVIAYYSGFLSKPKVEGVELTDEDKNGFMLAIHKLDKKKGLDLFIHTPGGNIAATESLVDYLKRMFGKDIRAFVPQIAMSAGTMLACSCKEIHMGKHSNLGPVDPSVRGIQAQGVLAEIEMAYEQMKADRARALVWHPILSKYPPSFVQLCQWGVERAEQFVEQSLRENMLSHLPEAERDAKAKSIVRTLSDLSTNKGHDRHLHITECEAMGLVVKPLEANKALQDLVLTVHHCYMHTLANTSAFKIIENHVGRCMAKLVQQQMVVVDPKTATPVVLPAPGGPPN